MMWASLHHMRPAETLEHQALLLARLSTPNYQAYMQPFLEDMERKQSGVLITDAEGRVSGWHFCNREQNRLQMAETYYVSPDMIQVSRWASHGLEEADSFRHDLWPSDYGFLWFDGSVLSHEVWGRTITTQAMSWGRSHANGQSGTMVVLYTNMNDPRDEVNAYVKAKAIEAGEWDKYTDMGNLHVHHMQWIADGSNCGPATLTAPDDYNKWANGDQTIAKDTENDTRFLLAVLMLMGQTITKVHTEMADRRTAKRMGRMSLPSQVTVIELRRHEGNRGDGESMVEWSHRWVVRGHWAWRACGEDYPGAQPYDKGWHVRLYIAPFIKGPDHAPFKQTDKVYALKR